MANEFGSLLRKFREATGLSMGQLARYLGVSTPYLSDVERGRRTPLSEQRIQQAVHFLGLGQNDHRKLVAAAAESRGFFELGTASTSAAKQEFGAALARGWASLDDERVKRMWKILEEEDE
jgi:transcriptional regulator with XRE-family HTH domain